jgi:hypothetical protein
MHSAMAAVDVQPKNSGTAFSRLTLLVFAHHPASAMWAATAFKTTRKLPGGLK